MKYPSGKTVYLPFILPMTLLMVLAGAVDLSADYKITVPGDGSVLVVDTESQETVRQFKTGDGKVRETFLIESQTLAVVSKMDQTTIWDIETGEIVRTIPRRIYAFAPNGERYVTYEAGEGGGLYIEDTKTSEKLAKLYSGDYGGPVELIFSSDSRFLAVHFNSEYPITDEQYPIPTLEHSVNWVELFDLKTNSRIEEFREYKSHFLGEFEGNAYYLRNSGIKIGGEPWDEGLRFIFDERRWEKVKSEGKGLIKPEGAAAVLEYDVYATILGTNTKLGKVSVDTYETYLTGTRRGCTIEASFTAEPTAPICCGNWWQIVESTSWSLSNCGGNPGTMADPHIDNKYTADHPHPRYNYTREAQYELSDQPSGPRTSASGSIQFETYFGIEKGENSKGIFYIPGATAGFRWGFDWDLATTTVSLKAITKAVDLTETEMDNSLTNSCFSTANWDMEIETPTNPCIEILKPVTANPAFVGPYTDPDEMKANIRVGPDYTSDVVSGLGASDFTVTIGGFGADVSTAGEKTKYYELKMMPPDDVDGIPKNDKYDMQVLAKKGTHEYKDQETDAVEYTDQRSVSVELVIDRSGSMGSYGYMEPAKNAASQFVELMLDEDQVGVVSFNQAASVNFTLTAITSPSVKASAQAAISSISSDGRTSIGSGMSTAQSQLNSLGEDDHAWAQVLLSDGQENEPPWIDDILPTIPQRTDIYTIALGSSADEAKLQHIATATGGAYFLAPSTSELQDIYNLIRGAVGGNQIVTSTSGTVAEGETSNESANIDDLIDILIFFLSWAGSDLDLTLRTPSGATIDSAAAAADPNIEYVKAETFEYYTIQSPEAGQWNASIYGDDTDYPSESYSLSVTGDTDLRIDGSFYEENPEVYQPIGLLVTLTNGPSPVTGAHVTAEITPPIYSTDNILDEDSPYFGTTHPMSPMEEIALYDDGAHGDGSANDGIYGTIYTNTDVPGSYIFDIKATGTTQAGRTYTRETLASTFVSSNYSNNASIGGTITSNTTDSNTVYVRAWLNDAGMTGQPDFMAEVTDTFPNDWSINGVPPGNYNVDAFMDLDGDGGYSSEEPYAAYDSTFNVGDYGYFLDVDLILVVQDFTNFNRVRAYPNPYRPEHKDTNVEGITFDNVPSNATIKIYTLAGELVRETKQGDIGDDSRWIWDLKNDDSDDVARGVYIYYMSSSGRSDTKTGKVAVIR
jgi:Mg-chelatase subunit ChlD